MRDQTRGRTVNSNVEGVVMPSAERSGQSGFSLIELLVAMVVTMIITGAMYGLLAGGQNAFQREPQLSDRQQAIRLGMARIQEDVAIAGQRLPLFSQVFTPAQNGQGWADGPNGPTDILEIIASTGDCPDIMTTPNPVNGSNIEMAWQVPDCFPDPGPVMLIYPNGVARPGWQHNVHKTPGTKILFPPGQQGSIEWGQLGGSPPQDEMSCPAPLSIGDYAGGVCPVADEPPVRIGAASVIRYQVWPDPNDNNLPGLWRSSLGGFDDAAVVDPDAATAAAAGWRLVARGVEDLQVQYRYDSDGDGVLDWNDEPNVDALTPDPMTVVREVRVLLGARTVQANLAGATAAATAAAGNAVRGQLVSTIVVRSALHNLMTEDAALYWH